MTTQTVRAYCSCSCLATHALAQDLIRGRCVAVSGGDTIEVLATGRELLRIRVVWIDCPELGQAFGRRAKQFMGTLVSAKTWNSVRTRSTATDAGVIPWPKRNCAAYINTITEHLNVLLVILNVS